NVERRLYFLAWFSPRYRRLRKTNERKTKVLERRLRFQNLGVEFQSAPHPVVRRGVAFAEGESININLVIAGGQLDARGNANQLLIASADNEGAHVNAIAGDGEIEIRNRDLVGNNFPHFCLVASDGPQDELALLARRN